MSDTIEDTSADEIERLRREVRHLRDGINAYRSVLSISGDRMPYSIVENKNLIYVRSWEYVDSVRTQRRCD